jgi:hypothetical protein
MRDIMMVDSDLYMYVQTHKMYKSEPRADHRRGKREWSVWLGSEANVSGSKASGSGC